MPKLDIKYVAQVALSRIDNVLAHWVPGGTFEGAEYKALNPTRNDKRLGSFSINRNTGIWSEFAEGKGGSDLVALVAYLENVNQGEACKRLAEFLGIDAEYGIAAAKNTSVISKKTSKTDKWVPLLPVPDSAIASCPTKHYQLGEPSHIWSYLSEDGRLLMKVMRFNVNSPNGSSKEYRPLTFCRPETDQEVGQWRWQQPNKNRPLYKLNLLSDRSCDHVLITEGEKAADAAQIIFPDLICTSWSGGSNALNKTDFSPLIGRVVFLWPDNDEPGRKSMEALSQKLIRLDCQVKIFDLSIFGENFPKKADAADVEKEGITISQMREWLSTGKMFGAEIITESNCSLQSGKDDAYSIGRFLINNNGVFFRSEMEDDDNALVRVCDRLDILALTRDKQGNNWGTLVRLTDPDGVVKEWNIPSELLATEGGSEVLRQLFNLGLRAESGQQPRRRLIQYVQSANTHQRYVLVNRLGWHGEAFLLPDRTIGKPKEPLYFYSNIPDLNKIAQQGSVAEWRDNIGGYCVGNPLLTFAVSAAFAAPLLNLVGMETTGFHFFGDSSQGKTTLLRAAASVYGGVDYVRTWRATDNALESVAAAHSDGLLILDEISQCDPRIVGDIAYLLGNGKGKARANDRGAVRGNAFEWRLIFLSSGERTLEQHMSEAGKKTKAGQEVRLLAIPSDAGSKLGIFNELHGYTGGSALSSALAENASKYYGTPICAFLEKLCVSDFTKLSENIRQKLTSFQSELEENASGQVRRAAAKFAIVAYAGELASSAGITGWSQGEAKLAALRSFKAWISARGGVGNLEDEQIISHVKLFFELYGESRFTRWDRNDSTVDDHSVRTMQRCGFRRTMEDSNALNDAKCTEVSGSACSEIVFYVTSEAFKTEVCGGYNLKRVKELLAECGALERDSEGGYTKPVRLPGYGRQKQRAYVIRPNMLLTLTTQSYTNCSASMDEL
ncbi:DUF927 domain-containing protein [Aurantivibrio plasticivorans]